MVEINIGIIFSYFFKIFEDLANGTCSEANCDDGDIEDGAARFVIIIPILIIIVLAALVVLIIVCCCYCSNRSRKKKPFISNRPQSSSQPRLQPTLMAPSSSTTSNQQISSNHPLNGAFDTGDELIPPAAIYHPPQLE